MRLKFSIALLYFIYLIPNGEAQEIENTIIEKYQSFKYTHSKEMSYLKTDKKIYFSGGVISFNLVVLDQYLRPTRLSKIAYLELIHESNKEHEKIVLRLDDGMVNGEIQLPNEIPTGNYQLVAYTQFMRNFDLKLLEHRLPIYIQNTSEPAQRVVSDIRYDKIQLVDTIERKSSHDIKFRVDQSSIVIEVTGEKSPENFYLISEGFGELQFIAKIKMKKNSSLLSISKTQFIGNFQKLILIDNNQNILALKNFYLQSDDQSEIAKEVFYQNQLEVKVNENLFSSIEINSNNFGRDSIDLFRRMYRLYYQVPLSERISHLPFHKLISDSYLSNLSKYGLERWSTIISASDLNDGITNMPESDNLQLNGYLDGDLSLLENSTLNVHFFENDLDINIPINRSGVFSIELIIPVGKDSFYAAVIDKNENDISDKFKLNFNSFPKTKYEEGVDFYDTNVTDEMVTSENELNYILSTFNELSSSKKFFWENEQIDRKIKVADYRDIFSVDEFIREVVTGVVIRNKDGKKFLRVVSPEGKSFFDKAPLVIVNNSVIKNSDLLFELPLEKIVSFNLIYTLESLKNFGSPFKNGVLAINMEDREMEFDEKDLDDRSRKFVSYQKRIKENHVLSSFSSTKMMNTTSEEYFVKRLTENNQSGTFNYNLQSITKNGIFYSRSKELLVTREKD